ncbi:response regulator transcription factor [Rubrivirga litoralis]|uniref:Response regulator transcription factor n=1 Tax=Rubrivirga litoralis TaxID=3075598 RepID=A0ABU3BPM2_9BACT|nr:response regulator transcription factor [Rubrivirga sp. F394]MDT0631218.1 response regulator transcription factor [Rubrivirga sp. F394]
MPLETPRTLSVIVVDDHPAVRDAVGHAVGGQSDMALVGGAGSAAEAFELARSARPDVAVVDISLGDAHGLDLVQTLRAERPGLAVVVFSMYDEAVYAERALRAGAMAYVRKTEPTSAVLDAVRSAAAGDIYLARRAASRILARVALGGSSSSSAVGGDGAASSAQLDELTDREMAVFQLLGQGRGPDDIADHLNLSRKTVETYRRRAKEKLGFESVTELLQFAIRWTYAQAGGAGRYSPE